METIPAHWQEVLEGAHVFIGVSVADILTPEMIKGMAEKPRSLPWPIPILKSTRTWHTRHRPDAIVATGRSDFPNQINNVLGFPFIFRGALDVRARQINDEMKIAASHALSQLAREPVQPETLKAYGIDHLEFGPEYIVPTPFDRRVCLWEAPAVARAAIQSGVARITMDMDA